MNTNSEEIRKTWTKPELQKLDVQQTEGGAGQIDDGMGYSMPGTSGGS